MESKQLIKEAIKEMIRDGEIEIVYDRVNSSLEYIGVDHWVDVEEVIDHVDFRLEVNGE